MAEKIIISATDLVDFSQRRGVTKVTKVKNVFEREPYSPEKDFYFRLRRKLISNLKGAKGAEDLLTFIENESDARKKPHFLAIVKGYIKFLKKKNVSWLVPNHADWNYKNELIIKVNPELGLLIGEEKYLVKLHFKDSKINSSEAQYILRLMEMSLCNGLYKGYKCALLDLRKGSFHAVNTKSIMLDELLEAEAESFLKIWKGFERRSA
ncbi:hypothetical protein EV198_3683 [Roseivirga ehrenbergii]|uniref:Uncharacterized protein n=1 Tax=Roseivirga ehrenbergii (strain DSM 102268 / JCM 13514 / KCTC 12282 / NCIMB 14502 / KMM 6017) TaxID=279360 RepID=A0A150XN67_ROSEK|nr:hypothetical protein [Roseivirga ehrenbergii]KYG80121.1 hypothetical protein MB14_16400 [Roseivirga ehrenbergii]TCK99150.1 hypothetical protein EV198_3683 [Roseivirga ehrenbergii]